MRANRRWGRGPLALLLLCGGLCAGSAAGCIIPDSGIRLLAERTNPGAVRLVQPVALTPEALDACDDVALSQTCPTPQRTLPFGLIEIPDRPFCICPPNQRDLNALAEFHIFVEDPDVGPDLEPLDVIFGALLLDPTNDSVPVAYENYLPTSEPARSVPGGAAYNNPIDRDPPNLKQWILGSETRVDLCNNNNGAPVAAGLHTLRLVVTDRPWYVPVVEADTEYEIGPELVDGVIVRQFDQDPARGVPDIPGGATYDTAAYVFRCLDAATSELCNCELPR